MRGPRMRLASRSPWPPAPALPAVAALPVEQHRHVGPWSALAAAVELRADTKAEVDAAHDPARRDTAANTARNCPGPAGADRPTAAGIEEEDVEHYELARAEDALGNEMRRTVKPRSQPLQTTV